MRYLALAVVLVLSGCGTMTVHQQEDGLKRLELTNVGIIAFPPEAAMGAQEVQMGFTSKAHQECPNGFEKVSERFIRPTAPKESAKMEWIIKCN